jgi:hypothetical protein
MKRPNSSTIEEREEDVKASLDHSPGSAEW